MSKKALAKNQVFEVIDTLNIMGYDLDFYDSYEDPLFLATDIAEMINHSNVSMMLFKLDDDLKAIIKIYTLGGLQETSFVTEEGLYEVLMKSRKPFAKKASKIIRRFLVKIRVAAAQAQKELVEQLTEKAVIAASSLIEKDEEIARLNRIISQYVRKSLPKS